MTAGSAVPSMAGKLEVMVVVFGGIQWMTITKWRMRCGLRHQIVDARCGGLQVPEMQEGSIIDGE